MARNIGKQPWFVVVVQFGGNISLLRNERLPKGPRFASESLDADTASGPVFPTDPLPGLCTWAHPSHLHDTN